MSRRRDAGVTHRLPRPFRCLCRTFKRNSTPQRPITPTHPNMQPTCQPNSDPSRRRTGSPGNGSPGPWPWPLSKAANRTTNTPANSFEDATTEPAPSTTTTTTTTNSPHLDASYGSSPNSRRTGSPGSESPGPWPWPLGKATYRTTNPANSIETGSSQASYRNSRSLSPRNHPLDIARMYGQWPALLLGTVVNPPHHAHNRCSDLLSGHVVQSPHPT